jgi:hypothetical protein
MQWLPNESKRLNGSAVTTWLTIAILLVTSVCHIWYPWADKQLTSFTETGKALWGWFYSPFMADVGDPK